MGFGMKRIGETVVSADISKIFVYIISNLNEITEDNVQSMNVGNLRRQELLIYSDWMDASTEQYFGDIGGTLGTDSWLERIYKDVQDAVNR